MTVMRNLAVSALAAGGVLLWLAPASAGPMPHANVAPAVTNADDAIVEKAHWRRRWHRHGWYHRPYHWGRPGIVLRFGGGPRFGYYQPWRRHYW